MQKREMERQLKAACRKYPVVTLLGPRQSGKTTLTKMTFPSMPYVSLEDPQIRDYALNDPVGFLNEYKNGAILDEVQRAPDLLSYIQGIVDKKGTSGQFILTGSQNMLLLEKIQSLAGRTSVLYLMPFSLKEIREFRKKKTSNVFQLLLYGSYPRVYDKRLNPKDWYSNYVATYVERDVRQILKIGDLLSFQTFLKLCAGHSGQLINLSAMASDCGISHNTAKAWLSVLEASYIVFQLRPFYKNINKSLVKTPKMHFYDSGLLCYLLGINDLSQLRSHPLRGAIFESYIASEIMKLKFNQNLSVDPTFYRDKNRQEIDMVLEQPKRIVLLEVKSAQTIKNISLSSFETLKKALQKNKNFSPKKIEKALIYAGSEKQSRTDLSILPWDKFSEIVC